MIPVLAVGEADQALAEAAAEPAPDDPADEHRQPGGAEVELGAGGAEIGVVADQRERGDTRDDDRGQDRSAGAGLERVAQLLDREHDAGQGRVERRRDTRGAAGQHERPLGLGARHASASAPSACMMEALTWTVGPSRPIEAPLSQAEQA